MVGLAVRMVERGVVPDVISRAGIRALLRRRLQSEARRSGSDPQADRKLIESLVSSPIAPTPDLPNEQHYELPADFFELVLGEHLKYSSCFWPDGVDKLDAAEAAMLELSCRRAEIENGMSVLDLGCGWGSMSLWIAERYPDTQVTALSNSKDQGEFIRRRAEAKGLTNIDVRTADVNDVDFKTRFDRVVSIEMFEHMRNYRLLLEMVSSWLTDEGKLFVHIFCHKSHAYPFEVRGEGDWMARYFFTSGLMPSRDLLSRFDEHLSIECRWDVNGRHYARTARAWLDNMDKRHKQVMSLFEEFYGAEAASLWFSRWRLFFMACEELFGYSSGNEWLVSHYLLQHSNKHG